MKKTRGAGIAIWMGGIILGLFGCSSETNQYSPEQVIQNALEEPDSLESYYAEAESVTREKGKETMQIYMKEWRDTNGNVRVETESETGDDKSIAVNDGKNITVYQVKANQAYVIDDPELLSFNPPSPKEQAQQLLEMIGDTNQVLQEGEAEIAGRQAYHLIANEKDKNTLFGDVELWIDKENWMVLKMISKIGDMETETIYTKINFGAKIPAEKFTIDLPGDAEIKNMDDMNKTSEVTLEEAKEKIGKAFYYFSEADGRDMTTIELVELEGELKRNEVNIDYKKDGLPFLTLTVFQSPEEADEYKLPQEESVSIRNQEGFYMETGEFRSLVWQEDGLSYSVMPIDPNLTLEDLQELAKDMAAIE